MNELGYQISSGENLGQNSPGFPKCLIRLALWGLIAGATILVFGGEITCPEQTKEYEGTVIPALLSEDSGTWGQPTKHLRTSHDRRLLVPEYVKPRPLRAAASSNASSLAAMRGMATAEYEERLITQTHPIDRPGQTLWSLYSSGIAATIIPNDFLSVHDLNPDLTATTYRALDEESGLQCVTALTRNDRIHYVPRNASKHPTG